MLVDGRVTLRTGLRVDLRVIVTVDTEDGVDWSACCWPEVELLESGFRIVDSCGMRGKVYAVVISRSAGGRA